MHSRHSRARHGARPAANPVAHPVVCEGALLGLEEGAREAARRTAEAELSRWRFREAYSLPRLLSAMQGAADGANPMQAVSLWLRVNCRGGWRHVRVPGGSSYFCMNDEACARAFRARFSGRVKGVHIGLA